MSLFIRSSTRLIQCTKRLFCDTALQNAQQIRKAYTPHSRKVFNINQLVESDLIINQKLINNEEIDESSWLKIREDMITNYPSTESNTDRKIHDICLYHNKVDAAMAYFKFLERNNYKLNLNVMGTYLKLYHIRQTPITKEEEEDICRVYNNIRKEYQLLDAQTSKNCILALSLTKRWQESFELLKMLKVTSTPGITVMGAIISAVFRNNNAELGWKLMNETILEAPLHHSIYLIYLEFCQTNFKNSKLKDEVDKMLVFWRDHDLIPAKFIMEKYMDFYESFGYSTGDVTILKNGRCPKCSNSLKKSTLDKKDFQLLSTTVLKNIIIGQNVYCTTSPQELKRYKLFLQTLKPYDVVIDGLNVAYVTRLNTKHAGSLGNILYVINYFQNVNKKRILVIGRAHMNWWSKETMKQIESKADVFLTKNLSEDDPFLLHVTLMSGPDTYFVSNDLMRQHKFKLDNLAMQRNFQRWQMSRQYFFQKLPGSTQMKLIPPTPFQSNVQNHEGGWHVPYTTHLSSEIPQVYTFPNNWICLKENVHANKRKM